jgi:hypothetical protein
MRILNKETSIMKKFLVIAFGLFLAANSLMAAYQYNNNYLTLNGTLKDHNENFLVGTDSNLTLNIIGLNQGSLSDWSGLIVETTNASGTTSQTVAITGNSINIGNVTAGDTLKFYLTGSQGTTNNSYDGTWGSGWDYNPEAGIDMYEYLYFAGNYGQWVSGYVSVQFQISGTPTPAPTGQPLPGALAALLVGGAGAGAFAIRRKKPVAA